VTTMLMLVPQETQAQSGYCSVFSNYSSSTTSAAVSTWCYYGYCQTLTYSGASCTYTGSIGTCTYYTCSTTYTSGGCTYTYSCTSAGSCFAPDMTVETQDRGVISVANIREGDVLKAWSLTESREVFSRFTGYQHDSAEEYARYNELITESEKSLKMTEGHLMGKLNADDQTEFVFASQIKVGDRVLTSGGQVERIARLDESVEKGVYAPMTAEGTVMVNNMVASCYSNYQSHTLAHAIHPLLMTLGNTLNAVLGYESTTEMARAIGVYTLANQLPFLSY